MDGRKNNGGNSTKAKGFDKRKNPYKNALSQASTPDEVKDVIVRLKEMAKKNDLQAIKLYLAYYLGNPKDTLEQTIVNTEPGLTKELIKEIKTALDEKY